MKLAVLCLVPEVGHVLPLIRIAMEARKDGHDILFCVPEEIAKLVKEYAFQVHSFGKVFPPYSEKLLTQISGTTPLTRKLIYNRLFELHYFQPLQRNVYDQLDKVETSVRAFDPHLLIADDLLFSGTVCAIASDFGVPVILHQGTGSNQPCQHVQPYVGRAWKLQQPFVRFISKVCGYIENKLTWAFKRPEWERRNQQISALQEYWKETATRKNALPSEAIHHVTTGLGVLEAKYLRDHIEVCQDIQLLGPLPPQKVVVGIPERVTQWMEAQKDKPIFFVSFGTMVSLSERQVYTIISAAKELDINLLWAFKTNPLGSNAGQNSHVLWAPWLPQPAILAHPAIKGFVSHAGSGAMQEALWYAQPLLCLPQLRDQPYNAWVAEKLGFGISIDKRKISKSRILRSLRILLNDEELRKRLRQLSEEIRLQNGSDRIRSIIMEAIKL